MGSEDDEGMFCGGLGKEGLSMGRAWEMRIQAFQINTVCSIYKYISEKHISACKIFIYIDLFVWILLLTCAFIQGDANDISVVEFSLWFTQVRSMNESMCDGWLQETHRPCPEIQ